MLHVGSTLHLMGDSTFEITEEALNTQASSWRAAGPVYRRVCGQHWLLLVLVVLKTQCQSDEEQRQER